MPSKDFHPSRPLAATLGAPPPARPKPELLAADSASVAAVVGGGVAPVAVLLVFSMPVLIPLCLHAADHVVVAESALTVSTDDRDAVEEAGGEADVPGLVGGREGGGA